MGFTSFCGWVGRKIAKGTSCLLKAPGYLTGKAIEGATYVAGSAVGLASDRLGDTIKNAGRAASNVIQIPGKVAGTGVEFAAGVATGVASLIVGDDEGAREAQEDLQDAVFSTGDHIEETAERAKDAYEGITGEGVFKEAKYKYYKLEEDNKKRFEELSSVRERLNKQVAAEVEGINKDKEIARTEFLRFAKVAADIADWQIAAYDVSESYLCSEVVAAPIKTKHEVFSDVDFDHDPVWNNVKGLITLGFLTESQVKDAEVTIDNQRRASEAKWADDEEDNRQIQRLCESLSFVRESFDVFLDFYVRLIDELRYAVTMLKRTQGLLDPFYFDENGRINLYFMPKRHVLALMAADKISRILCEMAKRRYVTESEGKNAIVENDENLVRDYRHEEYERIKEGLAA